MDRYYCKACNKEIYRKKEKPEYCGNCREKRYGKKWYLNNKKGVLMRAKQYYVENKEHILPRIRIYQEENKEKIKKKQRERPRTEKTRRLNIINRKIHNKRHPVRCKARNWASRQRKIGNIIRKPCVICGNIKTDAHHENYNFPFWILWICTYHHIWYHSMRKELNRVDKA